MMSDYNHPAVAYQLKQRQGVRPENPIHRSQVLLVLI